MSYFGVLMLIFGVSVLLVGLYMYSGHKLNIMTSRASFRNLDSEGWKQVGKWTMLTSLLIFLIALIAFIFKF